MLKWIRRRVGTFLKSTGGRLLNRGIDISAEFEVQRRPLREVEIELAALKAKLDAVSDEELANLPALLPEDHLLISRVIGLMNAYDFNARRLLHLLATLNGATHAYREPHDSKLGTRLVETLKTAPFSQDEILECTRRIEGIEYLRFFRNHVAHWSARRAGYGLDALVAFTMNVDVGSQRLSQKLVPFTATFVILPLPEARDLLGKATENHIWLAQKVAGWHTYLPGNARALAVPST